MTSPVLIFAVGNESRGDDAIAPSLLRRLEKWLSAEQKTKQVELIEEFQLQVEQATDMLGRELVLFVDAGMDTRDPYSFYRIKRNESRTLFSHSLTPEAVVSTYSRVFEKPPPASFVLCVKGEEFELGADLSQKALVRIEPALSLIQKLLMEPQVPAWENLCTS